jgi:hypothetical protein
LKVSIYDSRTNKYTDINTYKVKPTLQGKSSLILIHGHLFWAGSKLLGQPERVTELRSRRFQPGMGPLEYQSVIVSYDLGNRRFRTLTFEKEHGEDGTLGDIGNTDLYEPGRLVECGGVGYLLTRQVCACHHKSCFNLLTLYVMN